MHEELRHVDELDDSTGSRSILIASEKFALFAKNPWIGDKSYSGVDFRKFILLQSCRVQRIEIVIL